MVEDFIKEYAKKIANKPQAIEIHTQDVEDNTREITILADAEDVVCGSKVGDLRSYLSS